MKLRKQRCEHGYETLSKCIQCQSDKVAASYLPAGGLDTIGGEVQSPTFTQGEQINVPGTSVVFRNPLHVARAEEESGER